MPTRGTTADRWISSAQSPFQNTCPRGARRSPPHTATRPEISIHVPTRGTTANHSARPTSHDFNPRAHEGHDGGNCVGWNNHQHFNPRAHEGHDKQHCFSRLCSYISIHVPTRGTTLSSNPVIFQQDFNPRAHEGHDCRLFWIIIIFDISIHVPTRGTTRLLRTDRRKRNFNPRAHEGHDTKSNLHILSLRISIHVPTRGTTSSFACIRLSPPFQSTCPRGARLPGSSRLARG